MAFSADKETNPIRTGEVKSIIRGDDLPAYYYYIYIDGRPSIWPFIYDTEAEAIHSMDTRVRQLREIRKLK